MANEITKSGPSKIMDIIRSTQPKAIVELEFVKDKFINNYKLCNRSDGRTAELFYYSQMAHFQMLVASSTQLQTADPFTLYACFMTAAVRGWNLDPVEHECYLLSMAGKAVLWPQAPAKFKRLKQTQQALHSDQPKIVYKGDVFEVENGRVVRHVEKYETEEMIAGYVRVIINAKGDDAYFIYRKSDWESWRSHSPQKDGANWKSTNGQPKPGFLRTKLASHAYSEKTWASGQTPPGVEQYDVVVDIEDAPADTTHQIEQNGSSNDAASSNGRMQGNPAANGNGASAEARAAAAAMTADENDGQGVQVNDEDEALFN
jgi:hypothetical protein